MNCRIEYSEESGIVLWMETPCGFKQPIIRWVDLGEMKRFAGMLLDFYNYQTERERLGCGESDADKVKVVSEELLRQALGDSN